MRRFYLFTLLLGQCLTHAALAAPVVAAPAVSAPAASAQTWRPLLDRADRCDLDGKVQEALTLYRQAFSQMSGSDLASRAYVQTQIGLEYLRGGKYKESHDAIAQSSLLIKEQLKTGRHNEQLIYAITAVVEEADMRGRDGKLSKEARISCVEIARKIYVNCLPSMLNFDRCCNLSRLYVAFMEFARAEGCFVELSPRVAMTDKEKWDYNLRLALLQKLSHQPNHWELLCSRMRKVYGETEAALHIAAAQTWAVQYDDAVATISSAKAALVKKKEGQSGDMRSLMIGEASTEMDRGRYLQAEKIYKQWMAMPNTKNYHNGDEVRALLVKSLEAQKKTAEVKLYKTGNSRPNAKFDFLADEEKEAQDYERTKAQKNGRTK